MGLAHGPSPDAALPTQYPLRRDQPGRRCPSVLLSWAHTCLPPPADYHLAPLTSTPAPPVFALPVSLSPTGIPFFFFAPFLTGAWIRNPWLPCWAWHPFLCTLLDTILSAFCSAFPHLPSVSPYTVAARLVWSTRSSPFSVVPRPSPPYSSHPSSVPPHFSSAHLPRRVTHHGLRPPRRDDRHPPVGDG